MSDLFNLGKKDATTSLGRGDTPEYIQGGDYDTREKYNGGVAAAIKERANKSQQGGN